MVAPAPRNARGGSDLCRSRSPGTGTPHRHRWGRRLPSRFEAPYRGCVALRFRAGPLLGYQRARVGLAPNRLKDTRLFRFARLSSRPERPGESGAMEGAWWSREQQAKRDLTGCHGHHPCLLVSPGRGGHAWTTLPLLPGRRHRAAIRGVKARGANGSMRSTRALSGRPRCVPLWKCRRGSRSPAAQMLLARLGDLGQIRPRGRTPPGQGASRPCACPTGTRARRPGLPVPDRTRDRTESSPPWRCCRTSPRSVG